MFNHALYEKIPKLERFDTPLGRYYKTPSGVFLPSVTTVISQQSDNSWVDKWKARIGIEEAEKIRIQAGNRGTAVHNIMESYLLNDSHWKKKALPTNLYTFLDIKPILDSHVATVYGVEYGIYSEEDNIAGTIDGIVDWDGVMTILDLKTSKRPKELKDIPHYIVQAVAYANVFNATHDTNIEQIAIVMSVDHQKPRVFICNMEEYAELFYDVFINRDRLNLKELPKGN